MKLLVLDHFFAQDIDALRKAGGDGIEWREWHYHEARWEALRVFPRGVETGLEAFAAPSAADARERFAVIFERLLHEQFMRFQFEVFVVPSDVFFYVRSAREACHRLGVPLFVAQKETTIAEHTMVEHAARIAELAPPTHDHMTVCSERHKEFWVRAGADPATITVTGQPRFDFYAQLPARPAGRTVLFFSYHVDAYHPDELSSDEPVWARLHAETVSALSDLAAEGWRVLVKPHPQQVPPDLPRGLELIDGGADTRELIADADVVVGFQTTALFEAMLARKPVVYTGWDPEAVRLEAAMIPFADWGTSITVAREPSELAAAVRGPGIVTEEMMRSRREIVSGFLGPVDGHASQRTLEEIRRVCREFAEARTPAMDILRADLIERRAPLRLGRKALMKLDTARELARRAVGR